MSKNRPLLTKKCGFCHLEFSTRNQNAIYCSKKCANNASKLRIKERIITTKNESKLETKLTLLSQKEYLSINDSAKILGISRSTVYRYINSGDLIASRIGKRLFIKKIAIDILFKKNIIQGQPATVQTSLHQDEEYYTIEEILKKFTVSYSWFYALAKKHNIEKKTQKGKTHYNKKEVDTIFADKKVKDLSNYTTAVEIAEKYLMTLESTYTFASRENIPSIKVGNTTYYSKKHVHIAKADTHALKIDYYSVKEAMHKYNISRSALYNLIRYHNIPKIKKSKYIFIDKTALDHLF